MSSTSKIAQKYLLRENEPIYYKKITQIVLKQIKLETLTPDESVRSILSLSPLFDSYGKGMYGLHSWGLKWFKKYHEKGMYFSVSDIFFEIIEKRNTTTNINKISKIIEKQYPRRYKNIISRVPSEINKDPRFIRKSNREISLCKFKQKDFSPNNLKMNLNLTYELLANQERPSNLKTIMTSIPYQPTKNFSAKQVLILWLSLDKRFLKLGPKGNYGLREWVC